MATEDVILERRRDLMRETWRSLMEPVFEHAYDKDEWYDVYNKPEQLEMPW